MEKKNAANLAISRIITVIDFLKDAEKKPEALQYIPLARIALQDAINILKN